MIQFGVVTGAETIRAVQQGMTSARAPLARGGMKLANCSELTVI